MVSKDIFWWNDANSISENTITLDIILIDNCEPKTFEFVDNDYEWRKSSNTAGKIILAVVYDVTEDLVKKGTEEEARPEKPYKNVMLYTPDVGLASCMYDIHKLQFLYAWHI